MLQQRRMVLAILRGNLVGKSEHKDSRVCGRGLRVLMVAYQSEVGSSFIYYLRKERVWVKMKA